MTGKGKIILLNGSSSAGKTTLAMALQEELDQPYQHIALDQFRDGLPGLFRGYNSPSGTPGYRGLNVVPMDHDSGVRVTHVRFGDIGKRMLRGMHRAIAAFACEGNHVIVDDLMLHPWILEDYVDVLQGFYVLFVGVRCPMDVVNEREKKRRGRFPGTAMSHFHEVHAHDLYDLEIDTSNVSPRAGARVIKRYLESGQTPKAFERLRTEFNG